MQRLFWRLCSQSPEPPHSWDLQKINKDSLTRTLFVRKMFVKDSLTRSLFVRNFFVKRCFYLAAALLALVLAESRASTFLGLATHLQGFSYAYSFCQENVCETVLLPCTGSFCGYAYNIRELTRAFVRDTEQEDLHFFDAMLFCYQFRS